MGKRQKHNKNYIQESQEVSPYPAGDQKAAMNRQETSQRFHFELAVTLALRDWIVNKS